LAETEVKKEKSGDVETKTEKVAKGEPKKVEAGKEQDTSP